ncbi:DUF4245 domain-containing protein [Brachybacterium paraconglomeratum]|uniref:DUF4245 family protein n=1 Tax=Brachybacterium paraconglomeratum TaxID=173362 RepID=UPI0031EB213A
MHDLDDATSTPPDQAAPQGPAAPSDEAARPAPRPQPKSAYELPSKKNTVLRNMVWALALTMAVVIVIAIAFFGVGSDLEREPLENSELDVSESAERAQLSATFPVAVPVMGEEWSERSARFADGQDPRWVVQYSSPQGELVTLTEGSEVSAPMLSAALPGSVVEEELTIEGTDCSVLSGGDHGAGQLGISCQGADWGFLVHGDVEQAELEELAGAALASIS